MYLRLAPSASSHFSENTSDLLDLSPHQCVPSLDPAAPPLLSPHPQIHRCWPSERSSRTTSSSMTPSLAPRQPRSRHPPGPARPPPARIRTPPITSTPTFSPPDPCVLTDQMASICVRRCRSATSSHRSTRMTNIRLGLVSSSLDS